jgi:uncharacterized protein YvpB
MLDWLFGPQLPSAWYIPDNPQARDLRQRYNLTCEVCAFRQVMLHYGMDAPEEQLQQVLGTNENPDLGFRGEYWSNWGDLNNYGAHAPALKSLIERFPRPGVFAAHFLFNLDQAKQALVRNWLVIAWIPVELRRSYRVPIMTSAGARVVLVPGEHTITLHGYDPAGFYVYDPRPNMRVPDYVAAGALGAGMALFDYPGLAVQPLL